MSNVLVSLVSDQTIPNVLFIKEMENELEKDVRKYLFVSTEAMEDKGKTDSNVQGSRIEKSKTERIKVVEDSIGDINSKLREFAKKNLSDEDNLIINLTGGTKIMSIGVWNFFKERKSIIYYLPIGKNIYKQIFPPSESREHKLKFRISLKDYLISYGIEIKSKDINNTLKGKEYTEYLFREFLNDKIDMGIISELRKGGNKKEIQLDGRTESFLEKINFSTEKERYINKKEINYLIGGWFEEYEYNLIREHIQLDDDKIGLNAKISHKNTTNEFDVMFVFENTLYVVECKTSLGKGMLNRTLYKLSALKKNFGLSVKSYVFTLDKNLRNPEGEIKKDYQNRASLLGVRLVDRAILSEKNELNKIFNSIKGGVQDV